MPLPDIQTIIDLRPAGQEALNTSLAVIPLSLNDIEEGRHTLPPAGEPYLVVCERGAHSGLAARYLRTDGLQAEAWKGTLTELREALQKQP